MTDLIVVDNYLKIIPATGNRIEHPSKDIRFREYDNQIIFHYAGSMVDIYILEWNEFSRNGVAFSTKDELVAFLRYATGGMSNKSDGSYDVNVSRNDLANDAWGRLKVYQDTSLFHGMFTHNVPVTTWQETFNGTVQAFTNATSVDGALNLVAGATLNDKTNLKTFRNPRYEPNRGHLYSTACILPNPTSNTVRRWGTATDESGVFFELNSVGLYGVVRTTRNSATTEDRRLINTTGIDLSKGNVYDIQFQWRGVGNYKFFINLQEVINTGYLGTLTELSMYNPAAPIFFECENKGANDAIIVGCVDVTSEGGENNGKTYGSVSIDNNTGSVAISGYNQPIIAIRSKLTVGGLINTRDTLALLATAYSDQKSLLRIWATRDFTAITPNNQTWNDYGDGHLEFIEYDNPNVTTPMTFDTAKATLIFSSRVNLDTSYSTSALFEGRTDIYLTPGEMFVFTIHRENGGNASVGVTFEFAEAI